MSFLIGSATDYKHDDILRFILCLPAAFYKREGINVSTAFDKILKRIFETRRMLSVDIVHTLQATVKARTGFREDTLCRLEKCHVTDCETKASGRVMWETLDH